MEILQTDDITFDCPFCRHHLVVDKNGGGLELACPNCGKMVVIPKPTAPVAAAAQPASGTQAWPPPFPPPQLPSNPVKAAAAPPSPKPGAPAATPAMKSLGANPLFEFVKALFSRSLKDYGKRWGLVWGIALLVGFIMPVVIPRPGWMIPYRLVFPFVEVLGDSDVSVAAKLLSLYPLFAGIGMILLACLTRGWIRAGGMLGIGLLLWLVALPTREFSLLTTLPYCGAAGTGAFAFVTFLAMMIYVGLRVQVAAPGVLSARLLAGASGAVLLVSGLLLPLLREPFGLLVALPFQLLESNVFLGLIMLLTLLALAAVAVMACIKVAPKLLPQLLLVSLGIWMLWGVMLVSPLFLTMGRQWHAQRGLGVVLVPASLTVRTELVVYGLLAATVIGLLELFAVASAAGYNLTWLLSRMAGTTPPLTKKPTEQ